MRFLDIPHPVKIKGWPCYSVPQFSTTLVEVGGGDESADVNWDEALYTFRLPQAVRDFETFADLLEHWLVMQGPASLWPFRDPLDFASVRLDCPNVPPTITGADQLIGTGDNETTEFQLIKTYTRGGRNYVREIQLPIVSTVEVLIAGLTPDAAVGGPYTVSVQREGGVVTIDPAPQDGQAITAGYLFDLPVRFENDTALEGIVVSMQVSGFADLTLIHRRLC